ncbi:hypothetical protein A2U01_0077025, partial [Trifolium medium]|nr:hypothetical protein [Trifolium medium]
SVSSSLLSFSLSFAFTESTFFIGGDSRRGDPSFLVTHSVVMIFLMNLTFSSPGCGISRPWKSVQLSSFDELFYGVL